MGKGDEQEEAPGQLIGTLNLGQRGQTITAAAWLVRANHSTHTHFTHTTQLAQQLHCISLSGVTMASFVMADASLTLRADFDWRAKSQPRRRAEPHRRIPIQQRGQHRDATGRDGWGVHAARAQCMGALTAAAFTRRTHRIAARLTAAAQTTHRTAHRAHSHPALAQPWARRRRRR